MKKAQWQEKSIISYIKYIRCNRCNKRITHIRCNRKGSITADVVLVTFIIVLVILPLFTFVFDKYLMFIVLKEASDMLDMSCLSAYEALKFDEASMGVVTIDLQKLEIEFLKYAEYNSSMLPGVFYLRELDIISDSLPSSCSAGTILTRPSVHAVISICYNTGLFDRLVSGTEGFRVLNIHRDVELPIEH